MAEETTGANPLGATETLSFRDRMRERLVSERASEEPSSDDVANLSEPSDNEDGISHEEGLDSARQTETEEAEELDEPTEETEDEEAVAETSDDADPDEGLPAEVREYAERAEKAEERARSMERDYRIKTHKIAAATRDLEDSQQVVQKQAKFILNIADQAVSQFDTVNWSELRTKPEEYRQVKQAYDQALMQQDALKKSLSGVEDDHREQMERAKKREAEVSRDILQTTIDGWSNEMYGELRSFAIKELSYTESEFNSITDWRRIRDIEAQYKYSKTTDDVVRLRRKKAKQPARRQVEKRTAQTRNAQGQFQSAKEAFYSNPGDPEAKRNFFERKLATERRR